VELGPLVIEVLSNGTTARGSRMDQRYVVSTVAVRMNATPQNAAPKDAAVVPVVAAPQKQTRICPRGHSDARQIPALRRRQNALKEVIVRHRP